MEENQKNKENNQNVSEMKNNPERFWDSYPYGYRFAPTDEELIIDYLKPMNLNQPLPINKIKIIDVYQYSPQQLFAKYKEEEMFFFSLRDRKYPGGSRPSRAAGNGYWHNRTAQTPIGNKDQPIGYKTLLTFREGTMKDSTKTDWNMHEFTIDKKYAPSTSKAQPEMKLDGWVLCKVYKSKSGKKGKNPGKSNQETPLPTESLPPGLPYVDSQRPPHTGESSFPKPQVDQNPLFSVRPLPPGLHNFDHLTSAHTGGYCDPMPCSNQDLLSTGPPPSELYNTHSWMPGNSGQTCLPKPDQFGFQNVNSQMAAHNTGESCYPNLPWSQDPQFSVRPQPPGLHNFDHLISAHTGGYCDPMPCSNQDLLSTGPPPSEMYNNHSWMPVDSGQTCLPKPDQFGFQNVNSQMAAHNTGESCYPKAPLSQDPLLLNSAHPSGMYNPYSHLPQLPPLCPTIPHLSGTFNPYAQMCDNTGLNHFPMLQTYQDSPVSKRPLLPGMHNIDYTGEFMFPEPQSNKDFIHPTMSGTHYRASQTIACMQQNCYPESPRLPVSEHYCNEFPSFENHHNLPKEDEEVSSKLASDKPSQHGLQEKDDKQQGG